MTTTRRRARAWPFAAILTAAALLWLAAAGQAVTQGSAMELSSADFAAGGAIPQAFTCQGLDTSPELAWKGAPPGTKSLALTVIDIDAPRGNFIHWLVYNIPPKASGIPRGGPLPAGAKEGANDFGKRAWGGPCPPPGKSHRYVFTLYALDTPRVEGGGSPNEAVSRIKAHALATAQVTGRFQRH
jgi:Raf kinase inhibitor-like YbhB/YbcL family protein